MTDQIFISCSKKDSDFAIKLAEDSQAAGFKIWIDHAIGVGFTRHDKIIRGGT